MDEPTSYNSIYDKLVLNNQDWTGMLAYCFYKEHKRGYCDKIRAEKLREPSQAELCDFYRSTGIQSALDGYMSQGENLANTLRQVVLNEAQKVNQSAELARLFDEVGGIRTDVGTVITKVGEVHSDLNKPTTFMNLLPEAFKVVLATVMAAAMVGSIVLGYYTISRIVTWVEDASGTHSATQAVSTTLGSTGSPAVKTTDNH